jgi:hypothetical protein
VVEVTVGGEHAGEQEGGVDGGELAPPGPPAALHVQEVVVEAAEAGGVRLRLRPLGLRQKKRSVASVRSTAAARGRKPRSTPTGYAARAKPTTAMLAGESGWVLSRTSPLAGFACSTK